jgi:phage repressor protein C with HTH and peptisase S24 domain
MIESHNLRTSAGRLAYAMERAGISSAAELAERSGLKEAGVRHYVNGTRSITQRAAPYLARALSCSAAWLLTGEGDPPRGSPRLAEPDIQPFVAEPIPAFEETLSGGVRPVPLPPRPNRLMKVPLLGSGQAGPDGVFEFNSGEPIDYKDRPQALVGKAKIYCILVDGDSMSPAHNHGDLLFVDAARKPFPGRDAVIELYPEHEGGPQRAFIKRIVKLAPDYVELFEFKPKERTFRFSRDKIMNLHLVLTNNDMY